MKRIATLIAGLALLLPAAVAQANTSTCQGYSRLCTVVSTGAGTASRSTGAGTASTSAGSLSKQSSTLPFTGLDVVLLVAGGGTLLGAGLIVRRLSSVGVS